MKRKLQIGILGSIRKNKDKYIEKFLEYYNIGFNDSEIARKLLINNVTVSTWRNDLNLPKNFKYKCKFDELLFMDYYKQGLTWAEIARKLNISSSRALEYGVSKGLKTNYLDYPELLFTDLEFLVFLGTIYGDAYIGIPEDSKNARGHFAHSLKLKDYCIWKYELLKRFCSPPKIRHEIDKRSDKINYCIDVTIRSNPIFTKLYPLIYNNKIKYINKELFGKIEPLGIAVLFMDDGYYDHESYSISTNCFSILDIDIMIDIFKTKFDLTFRMHSNHVIRLAKADSIKFINLVRPYIHPDCLYKLKLDSLKTPLNGESPMLDNPVLSLQETEGDAERLEVMPNK